MTVTNDADTIRALEREMEKLSREVADFKRENAELRSGNAELKTRLAEFMRSRKDEYDGGSSDALVGTTPQYVTEGSFGKITALPLQSTVYKTTILGDKANGRKLRHEFSM